MLDLRQKAFFKIGEVAEIVDVRPHVLRYWEREFRLFRPQKSRANHRVYRRRDVEIIQAIKRLLYDEGYTIAGARKRLRDDLRGRAPGEPEDAGRVEADDGDDPQIALPLASQPGVGPESLEGAAPPVLAEKGTLPSAIEESIRQDTSAAASPDVGRLRALVEVEAARRCETERQLAALRKRTLELVTLLRQEIDALRADLSARSKSPGSR